MKVLEDNAGKPSAMRAMSFISLAAGIVFGYMTIGNPTPEATQITFVFVLGAFAPKAIQKFLEKK